MQWEISKALDQPHHRVAWRSRQCSFSTFLHCVAILMLILKESGSATPQRYHVASWHSQYGFQPVIIFFILQLFSTVLPYRQFVFLLFRPLHIFSKLIFFFFFFWKPVCCSLLLAVGSGCLQFTESTFLLLSRVISWMIFLGTNQSFFQNVFIPLKL